MGRDAARIPALFGYVRSAVGLLLSLGIDRLPYGSRRWLQRRRLRRLLGHARRRSAAYREITVSGDPFDALRCLTLVDRTVIQSDVDRVLTVDRSSAGLSVTATSGSSGVPVRIWSSLDDRARMRALYLADLVTLGLRPRDRLAYVRSSPFVRSPTARIGVLRSTHIDSRLPLPEQVDAFVRARPTFVVGFPNVILSIVEELQRRGHHHRSRVRRVVFGGEPVSSQVRETVEEFFGATTAEVYASVEAGTIARSCAHGALHLRIADVVVEVETPTGVELERGTGAILVTVLRRRAMVLLRYRLGDAVRITSDRCACRDRSPVVAAVRGRTEDRIVGPGGVRFHADFLTDIAEHHPTVRRQQVVQHPNGRIEVLVKLVDGADPAVLDRLRSQLRDSVPGLVVDVRQVDCFELSAGGKLRLVRSYVTSDDVL